MRLVLFYVCPDPTVRVEVAKWTFFANVERGNWRPPSLKKGNQMFHEWKETKLNPQERHGGNPPNYIRFSTSSSSSGLTSTSSQPLPSTTTASERYDHVFLKTEEKTFALKVLEPGSQGILLLKMQCRASWVYVSCCLLLRIVY